MAQNQSSKDQKTQEQPTKKGSLINKILVGLIVILLAFNINLYIKKYHTIDSNVQVQIDRSNDGKAISVNYNGQFINDAGLHKVMNGLSSVNNKEKVEELNLLFQMSFFTNLNLVLTTLEKFTNIKSLALAIGMNPIKNETAFALANTLGNIRNLNKLNLTIDQLYNREGREAIFKSISQLKLTELRVSMINTDLSNKSLEVLFYLKNIKTLNSLDLVMIGCQIKEKEADILGKFLGDIHQLEKLNINLYANRIVADGASSLASGMYFQKGVQEFGLDLFFNNITKIGTESISEVLKLMTNLTKLSFSLEFNYIENEGGVKISILNISKKIMVANAIKQLKKITNLKLNMATKNFGYIGYQAVILALHDISHLNELELIVGVNRCGKPGADDLKNLLVRHNKLKVLKFNFLENYVGDAGAFAIADGIRAQQNLQELQVIMSFNTLSDDGALELTKAVQQAKTPKIIDLRLTQNQINDDTALQIFNIIEETLPKVNKFEFEFLETALTNKTRDILLEKYTNVSKLEFRINTIPPSNWVKDLPETLETE